MQPDANQSPAHNPDGMVAGKASSTGAASIAVVVVTYRSAETIDRCLASLRGCRGVTQIRVVDNGSTDATLGIVQRHALQDARLRFIANPDNPGFSVACNQGAEASDAPWLAFINPDCYLQPDSLELLQRHAHAHPAGALLGADLMDGQGTRDGACRRRDPDFIAMLRDRRAADLGVPMQGDRPLQAVDAVSGAVMLLPRWLFRRIGGFDPGYRLHAEDLDLCRRARQAGALVAVANDVPVVHVRGVSSRSRPWFVDWHKHRGLWRYFTKFQAGSTSWPVRALVAAGIAAHFLKSRLHDVFDRSSGLSSPES